jgi:hypothetical protein
VVSPRRTRWGATTPDEDAIASVLSAAQAIGVELDADEAATWFAAVSSDVGGSLVADVDSGVYGRRVTMAEVDEAGVGRFRRVAAIVGFEDRPLQVTTVLALAGSAAQGRVHRFPVDCDFFERIHLRTDTRTAACELLAEVMYDKAIETMRGPGFRLYEVKFGTWPVDATVAGARIRAGSPILWRPADIERGEIEYSRPDGSPATMVWADAARDPGWCKLDWVLANPERGSLANVSNSIDVTWEAPDGTVTPLDRFLDPYFQEVYLESDSIPLFSRFVKQLGADGVAEYVAILRHEVREYTLEKPNHGKAARRLYNIFRLTGRYLDAAYIRELFDEPVGALDQLAALLPTVADAAASPDTFQADALVHEINPLIVSAIGALERPSEAEIVARLLRLRDAVSRRAAGCECAAELEEAKDDAMAGVDAFLARALRAVPSIAEYLDEVAASDV